MRTSQIANNCIIYNNKAISYRLQFSRRKTFAIHIYANSSIVVKAPKWMSIKKIEKRVLQKADWIIEKQEAFSLIYPKTPTRKYINNEVFKYLGNELTLQITHDIINKVSSQDNLLVVQTAFPDNSQKIKKLIDSWYKQQAQQILYLRFKDCQPIAEQIGIKFTGQLKLRNMKSRWGSCSTKGIITLNNHLIYAPQICIDYVILHELCHIKEHNHSKRFYDLLDKIMPNHKEIAKLLNKSVNLRCI